LALKGSWVLGSLEKASDAEWQGRGNNEQKLVFVRTRGCANGR
jgi:hypothetical protein